MSSKSQVVRLWLCLMLLALVAAVPGFAGSSVIGSVAGSMSASVGGQTLMPNTTLFSGDSLQVTDGMAVIAMGSGSRMVFGRDTAVSFLRDSNEVTVLLSHGNVSMFQGESGMPVRVKAGDVSVVPVSGFKTLGEVAMLNGTVVVTAKEGTFCVQGNGRTVNVAKGKTLTISPSANAPQGGGSPPPNGQGRYGSYAFWGATDAAISAVGVIFSAIAMSRAGNAETDANAATSAANAAAAAAAAAASAFGSEANSIGCALDILAQSEGDKTSPYTPPAGYTCSGT